MNIVYYVDIEDINDKNAVGPIKHFFKNLKNQKPDLFSLTMKTMEKVEEYRNLDILERQNRVSKLKNCDQPIYEFRIPPRRRGGVVRLYFGYKQNNNDTIIILSAEFKKKSEANKEKIKQAESRYLEVCI